MNDRQLAVYHRLPYPARMLAAGARGLWLNSWRYGPETERLVQEALERDEWSAELWSKWQARRLDEVLERAATAVPFYRARWRQAASGTCAEDYRQLEKWPVLGKEPLRRSPQDFLARGSRPSRMFAEHTSGTSGTPLRVWWSREATRHWYALYVARVLAWNGVGREDPWAILGGQLVAPPRQKTPPFWVWNFASRQLYLSSYHLAPDRAQAYLDAMRRHRVVYLLGYPSAMCALARSALELGLEAPRLAVAVANAEPLSPHQRQTITAAFGCPVRETYGMAEMVCGASECAAGTLHLWPEVGAIEVLGDSGLTSSRQGEAGQLVATGLLNPEMPLVRYATGDRVRLASGDERCACGRGLPILREIEGRRDDLVVTPDGRTIGRLDPVFKADLPIREAQIVQTHVDQLVVRVVPTPGYRDAHGQEIAERLEARVGAALNITVVLVDTIERGAAGKFRAVVSEI